MTDTLTFIHGGLYDGLDLNSKQNIRNLSLSEEDTKYILPVCSISIWNQKNIRYWKTEKYKSLW